MKKIVILFLALAAIICGGFFVYIDSVEKGFYKSLENIKSDTIKVRNDKFKKGLFVSKASFEIVIPKNRINELFALDEQSGANEDINLKIDMDIDHGLVGFGREAVAIGEVEFLSYRDAVKEIFDTAKPVKFSVQGKNISAQQVVFEFSKIDKTAEDVVIKMDKTIFSARIEDGKILENGFYNDKIFFGDSELKFAIEGAKYDAIYEKPYDIKDMFEYKFTNTVSKTNIKNIDIDTVDEKINIGKIASDTKLIVDGELLHQIDKTTIDKIRYMDSDLNSFVVKTKVENLDKAAIESIVSAKFQNEEQYIQEIMSAVGKILKREPKVTFEEISFKNTDSNNFVSNLQLSISSIDETFSILDLIGSLNLKGEVSLDVSPGEFLFKNLENEKSIIDQIALESGVFVKNGEKFESKFYYNKRTKDIIFNNKISLQTIMNTLFR